MTHRVPTLSAGLAACLLAALPAMVNARADGRGPVSMENAEARGMATEYWTAERFKAAKPLPMPSVYPESVRDEVQRGPAPGTPQGASGQPPSLQLNVAPKQLYTPAPPEQRENLLDGVAPQAGGTAASPYTSTRVFPSFTGANAALSADRAYPYVTVGKLFFTIGGAPYVCSASVIQRRVVATAGHCVHSGTAAGFHSNWVFVPAFRDGVAPLKQWNWRYVVTTSAWVSGGGVVPNAADYAMIEFGDQAMTPGGPLVKLGNVTGWLGWQTLSLNANHTSKLGYPCNLDNCQKLQNIASASYRATAPNNIEYGTDARGGSSGGPWVQNFNVWPVGGGTGSNTGQNRIVGITSYGYNSVDLKVQGASILDSRWVQMLDAICARAGNCN